MSLVTWAGLLAIPLAGLLGTAVGAKVAANATVKAAAATARAQEKTSSDTAQNQLIDQLQEELTGYRLQNDHRVGELEGEVKILRNENRGYRAFIGVQRDQMAEHGVPLPPWPENLPRG